MSSFRVPIITLLAAFVTCSLAASNNTPPCYTALNPDFETICYQNLMVDGNFSVRTLAAGQNNVLINTATAASINPWVSASTSVTEDLIAYFTGYNSAGLVLNLTVPIMYRPLPDGGLNASIAISTYFFPFPAYAPQPTGGYSVQEPFTEITVAVILFETPALATNLDYLFACGELTEWINIERLTTVAGEWQQVWVTYSQQVAAPHVNECWIQVESA